MIYPVPVCRRAALVVLGLTVTVCGCRSGTVAGESDGGELAASTIAVDKANGCSVTVPRGWRETAGPGNGAQLRFENKRESAWLTVRTLAKVDVQNPSLEAYATWCRSWMASRLEGESEGSTVTRILPQGFKALETEVRGSSKGFNYVYFYSVIDSGSHYHAIVGWTLVSQFPKLQSTFRKIADSLVLEEKDSSADDPAARESLAPAR